MKKYEDFLLEFDKPPFPGGPKTIEKPAQNSGDTQIVFDEVSYENINKSLKEFWNKILTKRMLNFAKDSEEQLEEKSKNPKYEKYWPDIKEFQNKLAQSKKEKQTTEERQKKVDTLISSFKSLKYYPNPINTNVINEYINKFPKLSSEELIKKILNEKGHQKVKPVKSNVKMT